MFQGFPQNSSAGWRSDPLDSFDNAIFWRKSVCSVKIANGPKIGSKGTSALGRERAAKTCCIENIERSSVNSTWSLMHLMDIQRVPAILNQGLGYSMNMHEFTGTNHVR